MTKFLGLIAILFIMLTFSSCKKKGVEEKINTQTAKNQVLKIAKKRLDLLDIHWVELMEKTIYPTVYATGVVSPKPNHEATLTTRLPGVIDKIWVLEGSNVQKGQLIITMTSSEFVQLQQQYLEAVVQKNFLQKDFERQSTLKEANVGALSEFQLVESKYLSAVATEKSLRAKIEMQGLNPDDLQDPSNAKIVPELKLRAPISGFIYNMPAKVGMRVEPGAVLAELIDLTELRADLNVYEKDLSLISEGQPVEIQFISGKIEPVQGKIDFISRSINKETRSIVIHASFKAPKNQLILPEMSITAKITGLNSGSVASVVPSAAIFDNGDQQYIFYTTQQTLGDTIAIRRAKVQTRSTDGEQVEIIPEEFIPKSIIKVAVNNLANLDAEYRKLFNQ